MPWKTLVAAAVLATSAVPAGAAELAPFVAQYSAKYTWLSVGDIRLELSRSDAPGAWVLETRGDASGLARLVASGTLVQTSSLEIHQGRIRPLRFSMDDGMESRKDDISLEFDWTRNRVTGVAKGKAVDAEVPPYTQDPVSFQLAIMVALEKGQPAGPLTMIDGPNPKTYEQRMVRREKLRTPAGTYDTILYVSSREGSQRETHMWLAPELGYLAVQVEQYRKGKRLFAMYLEKYRAQE